MNKFFTSYPGVKRWINESETMAIKNAPMSEHTHPIKLMPPNPAKVAGIIKTPAPIILPTTNEVLVHKPSLLSGDEFTKYVC